MNKKLLYYIAAGAAVIALGVGLYLLISAGKNKEFISSAEIVSVRARSAYDPTNAEEISDEAELLRLAEHFNSLELKKAEEPPEGGEEGVISVEFSYKNGKRITVYQLGERYLRLEGGEWMEIAGENADGLDGLLDSAKYASLRKSFPEYFSFDLNRGLDVFAWKENGEFVYGIAPMAALFDAGKYPTSLPSLTADELVIVLKNYESDEVRALISNACLIENEQNMCMFFHVDTYQAPYQSEAPGIVISEVSGSDWLFSGLDYTSSSIYLTPMIDNDPQSFERGCIRLLPLLKDNSEASKADHNELRSFFEKRIAPMFAPYERPEITWILD